MIEAVKGLLARTPKWLLVFDNAQEWADISAYWPVTGNGSVLITIQNPAITQFVTRHIGLPSFSIQDSCKLLFKHLNLDNSTVNPRDLAVAAVLSNDLGGLPMAIAHLAGYINQSQSSLESFKRQFHKRLNGSNIWNAKSMATTAFHDAPLGALWDIALANLQHESRQLLDVISFLNPDDIHEEVMIGNEPDVKKVEDFNATIADLRRRCLINRYPNEKLPYISVQRALQRNITYKIDQDIPRYAASLGLAIDLVRQAFPRRNKLEIPDHHNWVLYERYIPHVVRLRNIAQEASMSTNHSAALADLLTDAGHYLWHRGDMIGAKTALEAADSICRSIPEESSAITRASALAGLVAVDHALGGSARTQIELNNIEIVRLRSSYRSGDPETSDILLSNAWHDLGCTYLEIGNYDEAEKCLDRSLAIKINLGSETSMPFEFATEYEDMAYVRLSQGRSSDALRLIADAVRVAKMDEAANRCVILQFIFDWSVILLNSGHFQDALEKAQESLHGRDEVLGENAIHTLNSAYWVANCLYHLKRYAESESILLSVIQKSKSSQWSLEAITRTRYLLIQVLLALNRDTEAQSIENDLRLASTQLVQKGVVFPASSSRSIDSFDHSVSIYFGRSTGQLHRVVAD